jgi:hypothetical protein
MIRVFKTINENNFSHYSVHIQGIVYSSSQKTKHTSTALCNAIKKQTEKIFTFNNANFSCSLTIILNPIKKIIDIPYHQLLVLIADNVSNDNVAEADFCGLRIKINANHVNAITSYQNQRTISHEIGHLMGWDHPHARGEFNSVNPEANKAFEQCMSEEERRTNLMSQTWYIQKAGTNLNAGTQLTEKQLALAHLNYLENKLNKNFHLRGHLWWKYLRD